MAFLQADSGRVGEGIARGEEKRREHAGAGWGSEKIVRGRSVKVCVYGGGWEKKKRGVENKTKRGRHREFPQWQTTGRVRR